MSNASRGIHVGHDLSSLIDSYASYQRESTNRPAEAIYEVKMTSLDEKKMFNPESIASDYTEADDIMIGPRVVPGKENSDTEEGDRQEEYEYPYVDCKPPERGTQGCGLSDCPISNENSVAMTPIETEDYHTTAIIHPKRDGSTSSSEDYCQADNIPTVTEIPIDGTYTALIRHSEPEYSTTVTFSSPHGSPRDLSNIVGA
ncbi:hypothetical protein HOLleu_19563 [Holothuria leucospilota]|uniref:Uncharacterized protein n=1 Tax=Holothuria leucospilota TaxID=206669 RepID=A0A9Q1C081_HOLLE|nr:hypothetical protein HOLleu_19563 [Holothuria leucospilota]